MMVMGVGASRPTRHTHEIILVFADSLLSSSLFFHLLRRRRGEMKANSSSSNADSPSLRPYAAEVSCSSFGKQSALSSWILTPEISQMANQVQSSKLGRIAPNIVVVSNA